MIILTFDSEQLNKIIQNAVRTVISENGPATVTPDDGKQLISRKEAAHLAGVCLATLDNKVKAGVLTKYRTGGIVRFKKSEVIDAFSQSILTKSAGRARAQKP
ncbi:MAG TPA: helix-turn-helix domain-containing protein [Saprospiraceae bacterium]|jgi:excisionase family DNA binding protein|nr:helix-turn-helix domain-containing protein [Saprospiraceae bacterium]HPI07852.1 helix-turn-helix domain-containing protein [Saprospiraceae bacterium]